MAEPAVVKINLFGTEYQVASETNVGHTQEVARYVDARMREVASRLSLRSVSTIAVLAAINLADELRKESESNEQFEQAVEDSADRLSVLIDKRSESV
jgi:cell division protein ZapA